MLRRNGYWGPTCATLPLLVPMLRGCTVTCAHVAREHGYLCPCCARARLHAPMLRESGVTCAHVARARLLVPKLRWDGGCLGGCEPPSRPGPPRAQSFANGARTRTEFRARGKNAHGVLYLGQERAQSCVPGARTRTGFFTRGQNAHRVARPGATTRMGFVTRGKYAHLEGIKWPLTVHVGPGYLRRCA